MLKAPAPQQGSKSAMGRMFSLIAEQNSRHAAAARAGGV